MNDEERILKKLREHSDKKKELRATYKIEIVWGKNRTVIGPNTGAILIWESGNRFDSGGDEQMFWCGYKDCGKPIRSEFFREFSIVCPHCKRESVLDDISKKQFLETKGASSETRNMIIRMPVIHSEKLFKSLTKDVATLIEKLWMDLGCDADIYMKYHPSDIRSKELAIIDQARGRRARACYPLKNILKDISAGASASNRFLAFCRA